MAKKIIYISLIISIMLIKSGIVQAQFIASENANDSVQHVSEYFEQYLKGYYSQVFNIEAEDIGDLNLYNTIEKWLGTPYKYAGRTLKGIDCSALVNKIYESAYCFLLTGNSYSMFKSVKHLPKNELQEGDLVFFKTTRNKSISHVGVYLGNNKFVHASRSKGVTVSDLTHPYYKNRFVNGGRVEFLIN